MRLCEGRGLTGWEKYTGNKSIVQMNIFHCGINANHVPLFTLHPTRLGRLLLLMLAQDQQGTRENHRECRHCSVNVDE